MDLDPIEARANAVTEGRWAIWEDLNHQGYITVGDENGVLDERQSTEECNPVAHVYTQHDAEFIAAARGDVPALVARVRELEEENQKLRDDLNAATSVQVWPLTRVLSEIRCGSQDWSWEEEWADLDRRHATTGYLDQLEQQIRANGITMPVLLGNDGRLWDGHHRLRIAVRAGIPYVPVEVVRPKLDADDREITKEEA